MTEWKNFIGILFCEERPSVSLYSTQKTHKKILLKPKKMCITTTENTVTSTSVTIAKDIEVVNEMEKDVMMQSAEIDMILAFLRGSKEAVMFEYGSGGSTHYFAPHCKKLYS